MEARRALCSELGFSQFVLAHDDQLSNGLRFFGGPRNVVFDTICTRQTLDAAVESLNPGGLLVLLGFPHDMGDICLPYAKAYKWELPILLSRNYAPIDFTESVLLLESGQINSARMLTGTWPLKEFGAAYAELKAHPEQHVKIMIAP